MKKYWKLRYYKCITKYGKNNILLPYYKHSLDQSKDEDDFKERLECIDLLIKLVNYSILKDGASY